MAIYDWYKEHQSPSCSPTSGAFWIYSRVNFIQQNMAALDDLRLFKILDGWTLLRGFSRCLIEAGVVTTLDIGISAGDDTLDDGFDPDSASDWTAMSDLKTTDEEEAYGSDGYIWLRNMDLAIGSGVSDFMIEVMASPYDMEFKSFGS